MTEFHIIKKIPTLYKIQFYVVMEFFYDMKFRHYIKANKVKTVAVGYINWANYIFGHENRISEKLGCSAFFYVKYA